MKYTPFIDDKTGVAGFKCERSDGEVCHIYLNPSDNDDESNADIFVYIGQLEVNLSDDAPQCYIVPYFEQDEVKQSA